MAGPIYAQAADYVAEMLAAALAIDVIANPKSAIDPTDAGDGVLLIGAVANGSSTELNVLMGSAAPHELEHPLAFTLFAFGGAESDQAAAIGEAQMRAAEALQADSTLGGLVSDAAIGPPSDELMQAADTVRGHGVTMPINLLYRAASAVG